MDSQNTIEVRIASKSQEALVAAALKYVLEAFGASCEIKETEDVMRKKFRKMVDKEPDLTGTTFVIQKAGACVHCGSPSASLHK